MAYLGIDPNSIRYIGAEQAFKSLQLSPRATQALIRAGVSSPSALAAAAWTDEEAGAKFSSLSWRLSVDPDGNAKVAQEIERAKLELEARQTQPSAESPPDGAAT
ncbi:MAG: hypothetical protein ABIO39_02595 [Caulobacteraceae bacterium]